jgi:hypothetical protein
MSDIYTKKIINGLGLDSSEDTEIVGGDSADYSNVINDNYQTIMLNYINELNFNDITVGGYSSDSDSEKSIDITPEQHNEIVGGLNDEIIIVNDIDGNETEVIVKGSVEEQSDECDFCDESFVDDSSSDSNDSDSDSNFNINNFIKKK